jgi:hypothetical protein
MEQDDKKLMIIKEFSTDISTNIGTEHWYEHWRRYQGEARSGMASANW